MSKIFRHIRVNCNDNAFIAIIIQLWNEELPRPFQKVKDQDENRILEWPHCCTSALEFSLGNVGYGGIFPYPYIYEYIDTHFSPIYQRCGLLQDFNLLTPNCFTIAFVFTMMNDKYILVSNSVYF